MVVSACAPEGTTEPTAIEEPVDTEDGRFPRGFVWTREGGFTLLPAVRGAGVFPSGINDRGEVAGTVYDVPLDRKRAFIWSSGSDITYLDPSGSWAMTEAVALNDSGFVTGRVAGPNGPTGIFLWHRDSGMLTAQANSLAPGSPDPKALDASGRIYGNLFTSDDLRGFRWQLRPDGASAPEFLSYGVEYPHTYVVAANDAGQVLGYDGVWIWDPIVENRKPMLWTEGGERVDLFPECARQCGITVSALNNHGYIAGTIDRKAFRRSPSGALTVWNAPDNATAVAMNSRGDIVGTSAGQGPNGSWVGPWSWLWTAEGESVALGMPSGATRVFVTGINAKGQVTGYVQ